MKIFANAQVNKLKEYSRSYGGPETLEAAFVFEFENEIQLLDGLGRHTRTFRKGTRLLIGFTGTEITERAFKGRVKRAVKAQAEELEARRIEAEVKLKQLNATIKEQSERLQGIFDSNTEFRSRIKDRIRNYSSKNWRNWVVMKVAQKLNDEKFNGLELSSAKIREIAFAG